MNKNKIGLAEDYMRDLLSKRGLGNIGFTLNLLNPHSTFSAAEVIITGNEQMIRPAQIQEMMETQEPALDYGIVNNKKVISSDEEVDKIIQDYWKNYRASMQAGNGIEMMVEHDIDIGDWDTISQLKSRAQQFLWIDTLGEIGNDEDAIRRNDAFIANVGAIVLYTFQDALNKTNAEF